jgi:hypothetical protein
VSARLRRVARRLLGTPFRVDRRTDAPGLDLRPLGTHCPRLRARPVEGFEQAIATFREKRWELHRFTLEVTGDLLLDTSLGWTLRGRDLVQPANYGLTVQAIDYDRPNLLKWARAQLVHDRYRDVVWLPYAPGNYWHFLNDTLGGLKLLIDRYDLSGIPVLIDERARRSRHFAELVGLSTMLSSLDWRETSETRWVRCSRLLTAATWFGSHASFRDAFSLLDRLPPLRSEPRRRLFITRSPNTGRTASNAIELERMLAERGFEIVQFEGLTIPEQRELVNSGMAIIALHGAGMANLAFHEQAAKVRLLEITPADHLNPCFAFMAEEAGMDYHCLVAGPRDYGDRQNFRVPAERLARYLDQHFLS